MIKFATKDTQEEVRSMWKTCFDDSDEYMDIHFSRKYKNENTLILSDSSPVASLQMIPYNITYYKSLIPFSYISGACTLPEARKKGYMEQILLHSFGVMSERNIPITILIPAEDWLFNFYEKYGYAQCFDADEKPIRIKEILERNDFNIDKSYTDFQSIYSELDFCVQKSQQDFETLILENELDDFADQFNQVAMVRIIDAERMLSIFAESNPSKTFIIEVSDPLLSENNKILKIKKGTCSVATSSHDFSVSIDQLSQLLFGYNIESFGSPFTELFDTHQPIINLMY